MDRQSPDQASGMDHASPGPRRDRRPQDKRGAQRAHLAHVVPSRRDRDQACSLAATSEAALRDRFRLSAIARIAAAITIALITIAAMMHAAGALAYQAETVKDGGTIVGTVKFDGAPPARKPVEISKDREVCGATP